MQTAGFPNCCIQACPAKHSTFLHLKSPGNRDQRTKADKQEMIVLQL
jgi:hypothetical protein